jgi:uncharacterized membrane protein
MPNQLQRQEVIHHQNFEIIQGPLPEPEVLERYKNADPSFPERIMRMAEAHNTADVKIKYRISLSNLIVPIIGQIFTLVLGASSILACIYLVKAGYTGGAIAAIVCGFSPLVINSFKGLRQKKR